MPPRGTIRHESTENFAWFGRALAVLEKWNPMVSIELQGFLDRMFGRYVIANDAVQRVNKLVTLLHQAQHDLRMETQGPITVIVQTKMVFEYFEEVRKIIELAAQDLMFVDPYLEAEFVARYLQYVPDGVKVRLLTREKLAKLLPAIDVFVQQSCTVIEVRSAANFHDRYVFVDSLSCYQSGSSFKDGAKSSPTTLTQITDAFTPMLRTYEDLWKNAKVER
jgi:hypothetical protein